MERTGRLQREVPPVGGAESGAPGSLSRGQTTRCLAPRGRRTWRPAVLGIPSELAARLAALQVGFPLSEPKMTTRTIYLAIRVVKNTLSDTRSKVTRRRPRGERNSGSLPGKQREASRWPPIGAAPAPLQLCGQSWPPVGKAGFPPPLSRAGGQRGPRTPCHAHSY